MTTPPLPPISQEQMIAIAVGADNANDNKAKFANFCNKYGLLQSRVVRYLFGINLNDFTQNIQEIARTLSDQNQAAKVKTTFEDLLNQKWKVKNSQFITNVAIENLGRQARRSQSGSPEAPVTTDDMPKSSPSFQDIAKIVSDESSAKWNEIQEQTRKDLEKKSGFMATSREEQENMIRIEAEPFFILHIRNQFKIAGFSLSTISNSPDSLRIFLENDQLRPALVEYAKTNNLTAILDEHLVFVANKIFSERNIYIPEVNLQNFTDSPEQVTEAMGKISAAFRLENRSLFEVFKNQEAMKVFTQSSRLMLVLRSYPHTIIAEQLNNNSEKLWQQAIRSAKNELKKQSTYRDWSQEQKAEAINNMAMSIFIQYIQTPFKNIGLSLEKISDIPAALSIFLNNDQLRPALVEYAKTNQLTAILNQHLVFVAQNIYNNREEYTKIAANNASSSPPQLFANLTLQIRQAFQKEGRSLSEVFANQESIKIFTQSTRLKLVLIFYMKIKEAEQKPQEPAPSDTQVMKGRKQGAAKMLGKQHAETPGLYTQLDFKNFESDENQLKKAIHQFLLRNHSDKTDEGDQELVRAATELLNMIKDGVIQDYLEARDKARKK